MSTTDPAATTPEEPATSAPEGAADAVTEAADAAEAEVVVVTTEREVGLQRTVRFGRVLVGFTVLGVLAATLASLLFPITEGADYSLGQVVGFMALVGGAIGLMIGAIVSLILAAVAKRHRGTGIAIQADVR